MIFRRLLAEKGVNLRRVKVDIDGLQRGDAAEMLRKLPNGEKSGLGRSRDHAFALLPQLRWATGVEASHGRDAGRKRRLYQANVNSVGEAAKPLCHPIARHLGRRGKEPRRLPVFRACGHQPVDGLQEVRMIELAGDFLIELVRSK